MENYVGCKVKSGASLPEGDGDHAMVQVLGSDVCVDGVAGDLKEVQKLDFNLMNDMSSIGEMGSDMRKIQTLCSLVQIFGGETAPVERLPIVKSDNIVQNFMLEGGEATTIHENSIDGGRNVVNNLALNMNNEFRELSVPQMGESAARIKMGCLYSKNEVPVCDVVDRTISCVEKDPIEVIGLVDDAEHSGSVIHGIQVSDRSRFTGVMKEDVLFSKTDVAEVNSFGVEHYAFVESLSCSEESDYENSNDDSAKGKLETDYHPIVHFESSGKEAKTVESEYLAVSSINGVENSLRFAAKDQELEFKISRRSTKNDNFMQGESCTLVNQCVVNGEILSTNIEEVPKSEIGVLGIDNAEIHICPHEDKETKFLSANQANNPQIEQIIDIDQPGKLHKHQVMQGGGQIKSIGHLNVVQDSEVQIGIDCEQYGYCIDHDLQNTVQEMQFDEQTINGNSKHLSLHEVQLMEAEEFESEEKIVEQEIEVEELLPSDPEAVFYVSDLVWGEVRSHHWWPGQIFDPSDSSEQAMKYYKKDCYLVSYFGDQTFAWNDASELKPFCRYFSHIENINPSESFQNAVDSALREVSRRVELALACSCIPEETHNKIRYQIIENTGITGIRQESRTQDFCSGVDSFEPARLLDFLIELAKISSSTAANRLDLAIAKAELLAFYRFKGYGPLSEFQFCVGIEHHPTSIIDFNSQKTKHDSKESSLFDLMGGDYSEGNDSNPTHKQSFKVGECISRAAIQLTKFPSILMRAAEKTGTFDHESLSPDQLLSCLDSAACNPKSDHNLSKNIIDFFFDLRDHMVLKSSGNTKRKSPGAFEFEDMKDSYWTDRIIHSNIQKPSRRGRKRKRSVLKPSGCCLYGNDYELAAKRPAHDLSPTELILRFRRNDCVPGERNLNNMFRRFGALKELETEVDWARGCARVVFKRCSDAEVAFTSAGSFNIFGSEDVSYEISYSPSLSFKSGPLAIAEEHDLGHGHCS